MAKADKLLAQAQPHLEEGESVCAAVMGAYETKLMGNNTVRNGILLATDKRVVFYAKKLAGYDLESFPYRNISSFDQSKGMMGHSITFYASGNKVHVKWINSLPELAAFTESVKAAMTSRSENSAAVAAAPASADIDVMSQLKQLGELRELGVVTPEEFESKKAELLARL